MPLRLALGLSGALLSGVGLGYSFFTGSPLTWPTAMWGAIAGYSLYPNMLQGADKNAMESIRRLNTPVLHNLMTSGFKGDKGMKAFTELQSLDRSKRTMLQQLAVSKETPQAAQLGALTGGKTTPLFSLLQSMPGKLAETFKTMGKPMAKNDQEFMAAMIKNLPV